MKRADDAPRIASSNGWDRLPIPTISAANLAAPLKNMMAKPENRAAMKGKAISPALMRCRALRGFSVVQAPFRWATRSIAVAK